MKILPLSGDPADLSLRQASGDNKKKHDSFVKCKAPRAIIRTPWSYRERTFVPKISRMERIIGKKGLLDAQSYWVKTNQYTTTVHQQSP